MNDDALKKLWQQQPLKAPALPPAQLISAMHNKSGQLRRTLLARDVRELVACVIVGVVFGIYFFIERAPVSRVGALITVASSIFIAWRLLYARWTTPAARPDAALVESLHAELRSVGTQSKLLRSVLWWYLLPLTVGTLVFVWGMPSSTLGFKICFTVFTLALDVFLNWLNQWARAKQLLPIESQLKSLLRSAESGEPPDETLVTTLRPIVLSMEAASQVKPAEFNVSFWQLALWGEIGFVGIWVFLMLSLAIDNHVSKASQRPRDESAQAVRGEEAQRYTGVARTMIDLFNQGDYAAVQKLYNPDMSQAFPPQKASEFYARVAAQFGRIEGFEAPSSNGYRGWISFRLHGQRGDMLMSLALDGDNTISGLYLEPALKSPVALKSPLQRIFTWKHLAWLAALFLAGLLYSWLLYKVTRRAVGVSNLGIHLLKGQTLVLWEEIREVRPLRILNIRSLWLIKESGEKTIMPWSSLERHADLKSAVEGCAPPHHPLRNYLSLLKRI